MSATTLWAVTEGGMGEERDGRGGREKRSKVENRSGALGRTSLGCRRQETEPEERQRRGAIYMWRWLGRRETTLPLLADGPHPPPSTDPPRPHVLAVTPKCHVRPAPLPSLPPQPLLRDCWRVRPDVKCVRARFTLIFLFLLPCLFLPDRHSLLQ